jgi:hypothetical protein
VNSKGERNKRHFYIGEGDRKSIIFLKGSQASPTRLSDRSSMKMNVYEKKDEEVQNGDSSIFK